MSFIRPVSAVDGLFLVAVALLLVATLGVRADREGTARLAGVPGWLLFATFWAITAVAYLADRRYFLGTIGLVTVIVTGYGAFLVYRRRSEGWQLTVAFTVMGLLFVSYEWIDPVHRVAIDSVAASTAWLLARLGLSATVITGPDGYASVVAFHGLPLSHAVQIVSACTGISAIGLFVGLIAATDAPLRERLGAAGVIAAIVYALNLVRTAFVAGALGGSWFAAATGPIATVYGVTDPRLASYYLAEYVIAQFLVVVVLLGVYVLFARRFPALQRLVDGLTGAFLADVSRLLGGSPDA